MVRQPSRRSIDIPPFIVMDVLERAQCLERQGRSIVHMEVGEPDFQTPECVKDAAVKAIRDGETGYTHSQGLLELREAICARYSEAHGVEVDPSRVIVTSGTSPALFLAFAALLEAGDEVVMTDPHYACYPNFVSFLGGRSVFTPVFAADGFDIGPGELRSRVTGRTAAILLNSPANPTGAVLDGDRLAEAAALDVAIVSDEIYSGLSYDAPERSILEFTDEAFVLNGFSKVYAMTGWRLGYVIAPRRFVRPMQKIAQNFFISASAFVQRAGIAALERAGPEVERMVADYRARRDILLAGLRRIGFAVPVDPAGAFYVLVDARHIDADSNRLAFDILERAGVAVTPGIDFGAAAEGHLRFSYAAGAGDLSEGLRRLEAYLREKSDGHR